MLAKKYKLTKADEIKDILNKGNELKSPYFVIKYVESEEPINRFSIVVSNKFSKKAVIRNRLRRQIFEIIRLNSDKIAMKTPSNIVILPRMRASNLDYNEIQEQLIKLFTK